MSNDINPTQELIGLWQFSRGAEEKDTGLGDGIAQDGTFSGGAAARDGYLVLDGRNDRFDTRGEDGPFDLTSGKIEVRFVADTLKDDKSDDDSDDDKSDDDKSDDDSDDDRASGTQTLVNRGEYADRASEGHFAISLTETGAVQVSHVANGVSMTETTSAGLVNSGDVVTATYTWSETGGGKFVVKNATQGTEEEIAIETTGLTMEIGDNDDENFTFGARESDDGCYDQHFDGKIDYVAVYKSDGIVTGTNEDDVIGVGYVDDDGDAIDAGDLIFPPVGSDNDVVQAGAGDDRIDGNLGKDFIFAGSGDDTVRGGPGSDSIEGQTGDDVINAGSGAAALPDRAFPAYEGFPGYPADRNPFDDRDTVDGGAGDDTITTGDDDDVIRGGTGDDFIDSGIDDDDVSGGAGDDTVYGGEGEDRIDGGDGDDQLYGGLGPDAPDAINIRDDGLFRAPDPVTDNGRDVIEGGAGDDLLYGQDDDDTLSGGAGDDLLDGGIDDDSLFGGADADTFVNVNAGDTVDGGEDVTTGVDFDTLDLTGSVDQTAPGGSLNVSFDEDNAENGTVFYRDADGNAAGELRFTNIENVVPCFTPGTRIATPRGERLVEELRAGDRVITRDNGIQEIRWVGARTLSAGELARAEHLHPVLIKAGALGGGLPERDMLVSPQHRVLVANDRTALYFEEREVLVAAKHLIGTDGVSRVCPTALTYIHFMCERHEVVLSDGAWTESFQPGDQTLAGIGNAQRVEIFELFPDLQDSTGRAAYAAARRTLKRHEAQLIVT